MICARKSGGSLLKNFKLNYRGRLCSESFGGPRRRRMTPDKYPGRLILFEGPEGGGKSTLIKVMAERLRVNLGLNVVETKEPGHNTELGKRVRERLLYDKSLTNEEELALFIDGRADHFDSIVIPALKAGEIVLCDRSSKST